MTEAPVLATSSGVFGFGLSAPGLFSPGLLSPGVGVTVFALTVIVKESVSLPEVTVTVTSPAAVNGLVRSTVLPSRRPRTACIAVLQQRRLAVGPGARHRETGLGERLIHGVRVLSGLDVTLMDLSVAGSGSGSLAVTVTSKVAVLPLAVTVTVTVPLGERLVKRDRGTVLRGCERVLAGRQGLRAASDIVAVTASPVASNVSPTL